MASWNELAEEFRKAGTVYDIVRRRHLQELHQLTGRNVIVYYSGWLQKPDWHGQGGIRIDINDADKDCFMAAIHKLDRSKGLDLFLHTPGGEVAATESLGDYLRSMFNGDIRAIVPQLAMSGGTMIACACKEIIMGKHSSLGAIDPQLNGLPAHGIIEEFNTASEEISNDPSKIPLWQPIIAKYHPTLIGECQKAIVWSKEMVKDWLVTGMLNGTPNAKSVANKIVKELGDHALTKSHARHISQEKAKSIGLKIVELEANQPLQEAILSVHHCCIHTLSSTPVFKIVENHNGVAVNGIAQRAA